jgi:hypothetical protein
MKGEIFNILEDFIVDNWGRDVFEDIFEQVHDKLITKVPFVGPGTYPDDDFMAIVIQAVAKLGVTLEQAVHAFGVYAFPKLAEKMPAYVDGHKHPKDFLLSLHDIIHVEVKKLYPDAETPEFQYIDQEKDKLIMIYKSKRKLYNFVEGMFESVGTYFKVPINYKREIVSENCENEHCIFHLSFGDLK